jgi:hypothetical protein
MNDDAGSAGNPLDYPERPEVTRERARRVAALASECGEIIPRGPFNPAPTAPLTDADQGARGDPPARTMEEVLVQDDLDAALRFFDAARAEPITPADEGALGAAGSATALDFSRFRARRIRQRLLALLDALAAAIERRDLPAVWDVLDEGDACRCFPPAVREEALVVAGLPHTAFRPPTRLYRYYHMLTQLGDEPVGQEADPAQLPIALPADENGHASGREIAFPTRRPPGGGPGNGPDRRRSGSQ